MFQNILFTMSLSGSLVVLLYLLFYPFAKRYFSLVWRYRVLKMAVFFYLIPVARWKYQVFDAVRTYFPRLWERIYAEPKFHGAYSIVMENGLVRWSPGIYRVVFLLLICGIASVLLFSKTVLQDRNIRSIYRNTSTESENQDLHSIFSQMQKELHLKRQVKLRCSAYCQSPVTCGILFPVVYFPVYGEERPDDRSLQYMIKHELLHIKHQDILVRYLGFLVLAVHWFNPFCYFLVYELSSIGEMCCDSSVLEGEGEDGRKKYGELLLQMAVRKTPETWRSLLVGIAGTRQKKQMKRRIMEMKEKRKSKIVLSALVMILMGLSGGMTAFAYEPPQTIKDIEVDSGWLVNDQVVPDVWYQGEDENPAVVLWDDYFIDSIGNVTEATDQDLLGRAICKHDYSIPGTLCNHVKNGQGGCTVTEYAAKKCSLCGSLLRGDVTNVITYKNCPH